jgi:DNA topoisomerase-1
VATRKKSEAGASPATGRKKTTTTGNGDHSAALARKPGAPETAGGPRGRHTLVIVESPAKAKTINKYLGSDYKVLASYGHVRDLPRRRRKGEQVAGVDIEAGWVPTYVIVEREEGAKGRRSAKDIVAELKKEAGRARQVYLATDPDREGEAIAWHLEEALELDDAHTFRVTFNEITRKAVTEAVAHPGKINRDRVQAQEARRILDRIVGYPLSNLLGRKVARGSSAGRVQSVALRLVVDREREIEAFKPEEYWKITAHLAPAGTVSLPRKPLEVLRTAVPKTEDAAAREAEAEAAEADGKAGKKKPKVELPPGTYLAELAEWAGKKFDPKVEADAVGVAHLLDTARYVVKSVEQKDTPEKAPPPFITASLQQQASIRLHMTGERTMRAAQKLYEGVDLGSEGQVALITYMRTDSTRVSDEALQAVREHIQTSYGAPYLPEKPNFFASGKSAQEAHEAIRPTDLSYTPERVARLGLHGDQLRVYQLIYQRFVASQMTPAVFAVTKVDIEAAPMEGAERGVFRAQGKVLKFDGYRRVLAPARKGDDTELPPLSAGQEQDRLGLTASQHFTKPPPRYNEATLIDALKKQGIGRPSTYVPIISKITSPERGYIEVRGRAFYATTIGKTVTDLLVEHFPNVMNLKFTSHFEEELDEIETGKYHYREVLEEFWGPFSTALAEAEARMPATRGVETGEMCPKCGRPLVKNFSKKLGREFIGCSGFRDKEAPCKYIKPREGEEPREEPVETDIPCPTCGKNMLRRKARSGNEFLGCSGYPECKTTMNIGPDGQPVLATQATEYTCEKCKRPMVLREGRRGKFLACTGYPKCKNAKDVDEHGKPIEPVTADVACDKCGSPMAVKRGPRGPFLGCTAYPKCRHTRPLDDETRERLGVPKPPPKKPAPAIEVTERCPQCGEAMKLRQGRKGWFLGCSKYPKCRGVREVTAEMQEQLAEMGAVS